MISRQKYLKALAIVEAYYEERNAIIYKPAMTICDCNMSVKLYNILRSHYNLPYKTTIRNLGRISKADFISRRMVGTKTLSELMFITDMAGITLKP